MSKIFVSIMIIYLFSLTHAHAQAQTANIECKNPVLPLKINDGKLRISFIYPDQIGDYGMSFEHDKARRIIEKEFAGKVITNYFEKVPESADAERILNEISTSGNNLVIGTAFGYMESISKVACDNKHIRFEHYTGYKQTNNINTFDIRMYEGSYLAGMIAGHATKTNVIGFVAPIPIPEVIRNINSFTLGAQAINKNVKIRVAWTNEWFEPKKETDAALNLINSGADVLFQNTHSAAVLQTSEKMGKRAIGWISDMGNKNPIMPDEKSIGSKFGIVGVSRCIALSTYDKSNLGLELNSTYNKARRFLMSSSSAILNSADDILIKQIDYFSKFSKTPQGLGVFKSDYENCVNGIKPIEFGKKAHLASVTINFTPPYLKLTSSLLNNKWVGNTNSWWGLKEGVIDISSISDDVPSELKNKIESTKKEIKDGRLQIWKGPIFNQQGVDVLKQNQIADEKFLDRMNFYVKGVESKIPGR